MPQLENIDILGCILRSTINVIGRRTSDSYATVFISKTLRELSEKYVFLKFIEIKGDQYSETVETVTIDSNVNNIELKELGKATNDLMINLTKNMGKNAGYYFIREIKEALPFDYELAIKKIGVDLDLIQLQYVTETKEKFKFKIENSDVLTYSYKALFHILDREFDKSTAISTLTNLIMKLKDQYKLISSIEINDTRSIQGVDPINVDRFVNSEDPQKVGELIQKSFQDLNNFFSEKSNVSLVNELKEYLNADYLFKLEEMGVSLDILQLSHVLVFKNVLKALVDIISDTTTQNYAILLVNNVLRKFEDRFEYLEQVKIDSSRFSDSGDGIIVTKELNSVRPSELGRGIRKIMEDLIGSLGEEAGSQFVEKFKKRVGKAHLLRIEEIGVNLHLMELKQNLRW
jgi:hypothetical protein